MIISLVIMALMTAIFSFYGCGSAYIEPAISPIIAPIINIPYVAKKLKIHNICYFKV